ncbi:chlorophyllase [Flavobacterium sp. J27]|uniref:alpha/beta hydrolase family protein n=1 Tax=Flavobacterium sp. J27 TaxID=2060419 RepID=UPI001030E1FE|nr:chlorophyllase [Flavobacterium sp. J27]
MTSKNLIKKTSYMSVSPIVIEAPNRLVDMELRVSAPLNGHNLPIILISHGVGWSNFLSSYRGYEPLVECFAPNGFVVIQPTHLEAKSLDLPKDGPEGALYWKSRAKDFHFILDNLDEIISKVPSLEGRVDKDSIAIVGHSMGGHTVGMLAGMEVKDNVDGSITNLEEPRIKAFVMYGTPGIGKDLALTAAEKFPIFIDAEFSKMHREVLLVVGDIDAHPFFSERSDWRQDAYNYSPGKKSMLLVKNTHHMLGGISGYDCDEAAQLQDENPETMNFVRESTLAYIKSALNPLDTSWIDLKLQLQKDSDAKGIIKTK